jgi:hypothetical protein
VRLQLAATVDRQLDPLRREPLAQLGHHRRQLANVHQLHVRRGDDPLCAGSRRRERVVEALLHRVRPVVHPGEQMAVEIDHAG